MFALFIFFMFLIAFGSLGLTVWAVIDIVRKPFKKSNDQVLWLIVVLMLGVIGPIIYLVKRKELYAEELDTREYLPELEDDWGRAEPQNRYSDDDYV